MDEEKSTESQEITTYYVRYIILPAIILMVVVLGKFAIRSIIYPIVKESKIVQLHTQKQLPSSRKQSSLKIDNCQTTC
jgi:hypothetical protein